MSMFLNKFSGMTDSVELHMSVVSIKRVDPYAKEILSKSTHVALYKFNASNNEWEKTETEGALFLYSRNGEPFHSIIIMNRLNTENLIEPIVKEFEYQMQAPFLLYRNSKSKIFGIWFYNRDECVDLTLLLETVMDSIKENNVDRMKKKEDVDIFRLLTRAQENFNRTPPNKLGNKPQPPQFSSTPRAPDVTSQSVMDFFAKASTKTVAKPVDIPQGDIQFTLQRLMSNPAHSVEHIEKQQRSTTPQEQVITTRKKNSTADRRSVPANFETKELNGLEFIRMHSPQPAGKPEKERDVSSSPLAQLLETPQKPALMPPIMFASCSKDKPIANTRIEPLNKNQMIQALTYLLKTDGDFVTKLHEAYVKSLTELVNHN